ncbi:MAG: DNA alkylation repair protein [Candidatus Pacebacteria bacterium]|nr:DNA alkylation repair protein [Candidatus Paceibacterota bacterium]
MSEDRFSLKDHLFNKKSVTRFADLFYVQDSSFPKKEFVKKVCKKFPELELKERITHMTFELRKILPDNFSEAAEIIEQALPKELDPQKTDDDFGDFVLAPLGEYVRRYGCSKEYLKTSLDLLRECTKRFSSEFPIRYFLNTFPKETFAFLKEGASSDNYHVRRLSTEGLRPSLPWAIKIDIDYKKPLEVLDLLYNDRTRYVTRSVANHMNDISKINPVLAITTLKKWRDSDKQDSQEMEFILNHSLRTLVKKGNKEALEFLGFPSKPKISIIDKHIHTPEVVIGQKLEFSFTLHSQQKQNLIIDYRIDYVRKDGSTSPKIFKIKKGTFSKNEKISFTKKQPFRIMTTKKLYPGKHRIILQINGTQFPIGNFELVSDT